MTDYAPVEPTLAALAEADPEREVCGFVVADARGALEAVPAPNVAGDRARHAFEVDPATHLALARRLRREGGRIVAVYHSHVDGPARLSARDLEEALDEGLPVLPGVDQVVIGMRDGKVLSIQAFAWDGARFVPSGR